MSAGLIPLGVLVSRPLYQRLAQAAEACGEPFDQFVRHRLADSLPVSTTAVRSGCAGDGEAARAVSPKLTG